MHSCACADDILPVDDDSDDGSDEDEDMDDDDEPEEINFIDIAQRPSEVKTDVAPERLLQQVYLFQDPKTKEAKNCQLLEKAMLDNDFETFVQIADLYKSLPKPLDPPPIAFFWAITYDRPDMLDELIRRTGAGIELPEESLESDETTHDDQKKKKLPSKTYLGLNVHGKKRKDLAQKGDPNAPSLRRNNEFPLLWTAVHEGAEGCVRYLSSERPLSAYQYYASTHSDERAKYLRRVQDQIPKRIGWGLNELNESVVTAAVIGDKLGILKMVIDLHPADMQNALMAR